MKHWTIILLACLSLSACQTTVKGKSPDIKVKGDGYELEIEGDRDRDREFCPPGHAKKGWC